MATPQETHSSDTEPAAKSQASDEVQWLRTHSGLTWDQLGRVFGVSKRAVHGWANGFRMNKHHVRSMREFSAIVRMIEADVGLADADAVRARLLAPSVNGQSVVGYFRAQQAQRPEISAY